MTEATRSEIKEDNKNRNAQIREEVECYSNIITTADPPKGFRLCNAVVHLIKQNVTKKLQLRVAPQGGSRHAKAS
jgi:hypothetical protein